MPISQEHPWLQSLNIAALCPKCGEPELRRSHSLSAYERFVKQYTLRRPFRCHSCGWRGWCEESNLVFPITEEKIRATQTITPNDEIPDFDLGALPVNLARFKAHESQELTIDRSLPIAPPLTEDRAEQPDVARTQSSEITAAPVQITPAQIAPATAQPAADTPPPVDTNARLHVTDLDPAYFGFEEAVPPPIEAASAGPVSARVSDDYHSESRNTSHACPGCGKYNLHRSRPRTASERVRRVVSALRLYRCHSCGWRGWVERD